MKTIKTAEEMFFKKYKEWEKKMDFPELTFEEFKNETSWNFFIPLLEEYHSKFSQPLTDGEVEKLAEECEMKIESMEELEKMNGKTIWSEEMISVLSRASQALRSNKVEVVSDEKKYSHQQLINILCAYESGTNINSGEIVKEIVKEWLTNNSEQLKLQPK